MLLLAPSVGKLQLVTAAATVIDVHASYVDLTLATGLFANAAPRNTAINTATTTDIVPAPGAGVSRNVQALYIRNRSTALSNTVTVKHVDSTTSELISCKLYPGYVLATVDGRTWDLLDASGAAIQKIDSRAVESVYDAQKDFGFVGDLITVFDGAASTGFPTKITSATAAFSTHAVVGQRITLAGAGAGGAMYVGTITFIDTATQVTVTPNISTTVSGKGLSYGTDNTAAINSMMSTINNSTFSGGVVFFGKSYSNAYGFPIPVVFTKSCQIEGVGGGFNSDAGDYTKQSGTRLAWWGASADGGVDFGAFFSWAPASTSALKRVALRRCWLDCRNGDQNEALIGLSLRACYGFIIDDFHINDPLAIGLYLNTDADPNESDSTQAFSVTNFSVRCIDPPSAGAVTTPFTITSNSNLTTTPQDFLVAANTLPASGYVWIITTIGYPALVKYTGGGTTTLTECYVSADDAPNALAISGGGVGNVVEASPSNACAIMCNGSTTDNVNFGLFSMAYLYHGNTWGPAAVELRATDSLNWHQLIVRGGSRVDEGSVNRIRKPGVRLNGSNTSAVLAASNNIFRGGSPGTGGVSAMGSLADGTTRMLVASGPNYWYGYGLNDGEPIPSIESNALFDWRSNGGFNAGPVGFASISDQIITAATLTQILGGLVLIPLQGLRAGVKLRWRVWCSKTASGVAARSFFLKIGPLGTIADATIATFTMGTPTAAADNAYIEIDWTLRSLGVSATSAAALRMTHNASATGFSTVPNEVIQGSTATFSTISGQQLLIGLYVTTGAAETITVSQCDVACINVANP